MLAVTRWVVAALAAAVLVVVWSSLFQSAGATVERRRVAAIAKWLEDLRDLQRGSNLDLPQALDRSAFRAPKDIDNELARYVDRVRHHTPIERALLELAADLDHPTSDLAIAAMLFAYGHASGSTLYDTFEELAATARDELTARDQIDRVRVRFESSMRRMIVILGATDRLPADRLTRHHRRILHGRRPGVAGRTDRHLGVRPVVAAQAVALPPRRPLPRLRRSGRPVLGGGVVTVLQAAFIAGISTVLAGWCLWRAITITAPSVATVYRKMYGNPFEVPPHRHVTVGTTDRRRSAAPLAATSIADRFAASKRFELRVADVHRHRRSHTGRPPPPWSGSSPPSRPPCNAGRRRGPGPGVAAGGGAVRDRLRYRLVSVRHDLGVVERTGTRTSGRGSPRISPWCRCA